MFPVDVFPGKSPVILAMPHGGTFVFSMYREQLNAEGLKLRDTDWRIARLYEGLLPRATVVRANFSRYVIDANRDPSGKSLYPGQYTTDLVPLTDFDRIPIWKTPPDKAQIAQRLDRFHRPYHKALKAEIERVKAIHGLAVVYDCHSIRSKVPRLFPGVLPDFNIGTDNGQTCDPRFEKAVTRIVKQAEGYTHVVNGRFRGGWTTRHYGMPANDVHAIQMELSQAAYLEKESIPFSYDEAKAERLRVHLARILKRMERIALDMAREKRKQGQAA